MDAICCLIALALVLLVSVHVSAETLLDDRWEDGSRSETNFPAEAPVWVGRDADVTVAPGVLSTKMGQSSQKIWTYFTGETPVTLDIGEYLTAAVSFIPRGSLHSTTSRSFRLGVFVDPTDVRVARDVNDDGGGDGAPWTDSTGYAVQVLLSGDEYPGARPFDLGKRTNLESVSLLGTSGDYQKSSGGNVTQLNVDTEYTVTLEVTKVSATRVDLRATLSQGEQQLSTWTAIDDGATLGSNPISDKFDQLFIRISDSATTADQIDFTNFKVEVTEGNQ